MNVTLLRHKNIGEPSCSKLVKRLSELGIKVNKTDSYREDLSDTDILIRWGVTSNFPLKKGAIVLNKRQSIELGANKSESRRVMQENGVSVPNSYFSMEEALNSNPKFPLIGRENSHHTQGRGIVYIKDENDLKNSNCAYYAEFIQKEKEFRCYIFQNRCIGMVEKIVADKSQLAWNSHKGGVFVDIFDLENYTEVINEAIKATKAVGQTFSGCDLMLFRNKPFVLENNSSIALSNPHRVNIFAQAFKKVIGNHALSL